MGWYGSTTNQTSLPNPWAQTVKYSLLSFCPCTAKVSLKFHTQSTDRLITNIYFQAERKEGDKLLWVVTKRSTSLSRCFCPSGGQISKLGHTPQMCYCFLPRHAYIKCILFQCLPYLPMPCYAVHMCCCNWVIALLLAEWIKKTQIYCFSTVYAPSFM